MTNDLSVTDESRAGGAFYTEYGPPFVAIQVGDREGLDYSVRCRRASSSSRGRFPVLGGERVAYLLDHHMASDRWQNHRRRGALDELERSSFGAAGRSGLVGRTSDALRSPQSSRVPGKRRAGYEPEPE